MLEGKTEISNKRLSHIFSLATHCFHHLTTTCKYPVTCNYIFKSKLKWFVSLQLKSSLLRHINSMAKMDYGNQVPINISCLVFGTVHADNCAPYLKRPDTVILKLTILPLIRHAKCVKCTHFYRNYDDGHPSIHTSVNRQLVWKLKYIKSIFVTKALVVLLIHTT